MALTRLAGRDPGTGQSLAVEIRDGKIADIRRGTDSEGPYIAPGLVDLQVNGYRGVDLNDGALAPERVSALCRIMLSCGITTFLPTLITASRETICSGLAAIAAARREDRLAARMIPFAHVEGPFISPEDGPRGAHPLQHVRKPDISEVGAWQHASGNIMGMVTLSPAHEGAPEFIAALAAQGIHAALGHTSATAGQIRAAADAGASLSTHLGNGAAALLPRHPNFIWAQLADDRLQASFIADGFHLPADALKAMLRAKGLQRSILVSDLAALGGMPAGLYDQPIGGRVEISADGRLSAAGTPYLAGAGRALNENVALAIDMAGLSLGDALSLATTNPGRFAGGRGMLAIGESADLILFDWQPGGPKLRIRETWVAGVQEYSA